MAFGSMWGAFTAPGDPPRSGGSGVHTPGPVRLILELTVFFGVVATLHHAGPHAPL